MVPQQPTFAEPSLTVNNLARVIGKVTSDKRKVWEKVLSYRVYPWRKYNPESYLDAVNTKYKTEEAKVSVLADVYVNSRPESSWEHLVRDLYESGEMEAAKEAKSFLQQNGGCFFFLIINQQYIQSTVPGPYRERFVFNSLIN